MGGKNVFLGGASQGCGTALHIALTYKGDLGGVIGRLVRSVRGRTRHLGRVLDLGTDGSRIRYLTHICLDLTSLLGNGGLCHHVLSHTCRTYNLYIDERCVREIDATSQCHVLVALRVFDDLLCQGTMGHLLTCTPITPEWLAKKIPIFVQLGVKVQAN